MSALRELYQQVIIDHGRHPRNQGVLENPTHSHVGFNPLCGDKLNLTINVEKDVIQEAQFIGSGCAISIASASLMTEMLKGKNVEEAHEIFHNVHQLLTGQCNDPEKLGKLSVLSGVAEFPARVKCATLAWHTLDAALSRANLPVSTE